MMNKEKTVDELVNEFEIHFRKLHRKEKSFEAYDLTFKALKRLMAAQGIERYDLSVGHSFVKTKLGDYGYTTLKQSQKRLVNTIETLGAFQKTGEILSAAAIKKKSIPTLYGEIGFVMQEYVA